MKANRTSRNLIGRDGSAGENSSIDQTQGNTLPRILQIHERIRGMFYGRPDVLHQIARMLIHRAKPR